MNSGMRVFSRQIALELFAFLPDGFSLTTTITLAMLARGDEVAFVPVPYRRRIGSSKIRPIRDTLRFGELILRTGMYFRPLRVLAPVILVLALITTASVGWDVFVERNLTDKTTMLLFLLVNVSFFALLADMLDKRLGRVRHLPRAGD